MTSIVAIEEILQHLTMEVEIGAALVAARKARGLNAPAVARKLGVAVQAVYQWEKGKTRPSPDNMRRIAALFEISVGDLFEGRVVPLDPHGGERGETGVQESAGRGATSSVSLALDAPSFRSQAGRGRDVPELGIAVGGSDGDFSLNGTTIGYAPRPLALLKRDVFAVRVRNDSMYPRFREGALLYVERHREPAVGEDGVFEMYPDVEDQAGAAFIKELVSKNMHTVVVRQFNPLDEFAYERRRLKAMYRVVPMNELLGV